MTTVATSASTQPGNAEPINALDPDAPALPTEGDTVRAREISHAEVLTLVEQRCSIRLYRLAAGKLTPALLVPQAPRPSAEARRLRSRLRDAQKRRNGVDEDLLAVREEQASRGAYFAAVPDGRGGFRVDVDAEPVGYAYEFEVRVDTGTVSSATLFSTPEAEESARLIDGAGRILNDRLSLYVHDPKADPVPLQPYFGATATISANIAGIGPAEAKARIEKALRAEFGDDLRRLLDIRTRPVTSDLHDVYDAETDQLIALGVLGPEISQFMRRPGHIQTRPSSGTNIVVGG